MTVPIIILTFTGSSLLWIAGGRGSSPPPFLLYLPATVADTLHLHLVRARVGDRLSVLIQRDFVELPSHRLHGVLPVPRRVVAVLLLDSHSGVVEDRLPASVERHRQDGDAAEEESCNDSAASVGERHDVLLLGGGSTS